MDWKIIFLIFFVLILLDKGLTVLNIKLVQKNYPNSDALAIEKNPIVKWIFQKQGLYVGTIITIVYSMIILLILFWILSWSAGIWFPTNSYGIAAYIIIIVHGFVIANNFYFALRYAGYI